MLRMILILAVALAFTACGDDDNAAPSRYGPDKTIVSGGESGEFTTPNGEGCIELESGACIRPQDTCGDNGTAQVVVDSTGEVLRVHCVDQESDVIYADESGFPDDQDGSLIVVDDATTVGGDTSLEGSNVVVVGEEGSTINGDVRVGGDQNLISGVRITGNLLLTGSGATAVDCVVEGDVQIPGNGGVLSNCVVFGNIKITGNAARLVYNTVQGTLDSNAGTLECVGNEAFTDGNEDLALQEEEISGPFECGGESGGP